MPVPTVSTPILWTWRKDFPNQYTPRVLPGRNAPSCSRQATASLPAWYAWPRSTLLLNGGPPAPPSSTPPPWPTQGRQRPPYLGPALGSQLHRSLAVSRPLRAKKQGCLKIQRGVRLEWFRLMVTIRALSVNIPGANKESEVLCICELIFFRCHLVGKVWSQEHKLRLYPTW